MHHTNFYRAQSKEKNCPPRPPPHSQLHPPDAHPPESPDIALCPAPRAWRPLDAARQRRRESCLHTLAL